MPSDSHQLSLYTQEDNTITGIHSYYYERSSMWCSDSDGDREEKIFFKNKEYLIQELTQHKTLNTYIYNHYDVSLDTIPIMKHGKMVSSINNTISFPSH